MLYLSAHAFVLKWSHHMKSTLLLIGISGLSLGFIVFGFASKATANDVSIIANDFIGEVVETCYTNSSDISLKINELQNTPSIEYSRANRTPIPRETGH